MRKSMYYFMVLMGISLMVVSLSGLAQAGPPLKPGNPGVPGLLAEIARLEQTIANQNATIQGLQAILDAMQNYAPVPQTGQTTSYDANTVQRDDGALQEGVPLPSLRFTDNFNGTVTDNLTKLIWLKNANCANATMYWQPALDSVAELNSSGKMNGQDCGDNSNAGNNQTDWRLPNVRELQSLVDYGQSNPELPALPFGHPFTGFQESDYWSSTTNTRRTGYAWSVGFYFGYGAFAGKTDGLFFVTAVRGGN
jgi:hypothetical protein